MGLCVSCCDREKTTYDFLVEPLNNSYYYDGVTYVCSDECNE